MPVPNDVLIEKFTKAIDSLMEKILKEQAPTKQNLNTYDDRGRTLLHYYCALGDIKKIDELISNGADINLRELSTTGKGFSPLEVAIIFGQTNVVEHLLKKNITLEMSILNQIMSDEIRPTIHSNIQEKLSKRANEPFQSASSELLPFLKQAVSIDAVEIFRLIASKPELTDRFNYLLSDYSNELLVEAAKNNSKEICKYLLIEKKVKMEPSNLNEPSATHIAIFNGKWDIVKIFLENGYNINTRDNNGDSLLQSAILGKNIETIMNILDAKIDLELENNHDENFLHTLFKSGLSHEIVKQVLQKIELKVLEKLLTAPDMYGFSPFAIAKDNGFSDVLNSLNIGNISPIPPRASAVKTDLNQTPLIEKMKLFMPYSTQTHQIAFSDAGFCMGYSLMLQLLGEEKFNAILDCFEKWNGSPDTLEAPLPEGLLKDLSFKNMGDMFDEFVYCISWAQQTWLSMGGEIDLEKILKGFNVPYTIYTELEVNTSKKENVSTFLTAFKKCPPNTRALILGDGHACSMRITNNNDINYRDPNHDKLLPEYSITEKLTKVLLNTKFNMRGSWSSTNFIIFRCGDDHQLKNDNVITSNFPNSQKEFKIEYSYAKNKSGLFKTSQTQKMQYKEDKIYADRPPDLQRFFITGQQQKQTLSPKAV